MNKIYKKIWPEYFMQAAIKEAFKAKGPKRFGAVIVKNGKIIARAHNTTFETGKNLSCAELNAIAKAAKKLNNRKLEGCTLYATGESCLICTGLIIKSRIRNIFVGFSHQDYAKMDGRNELKPWSKPMKKLIPKDTKITIGILRKECMAMMPNPNFQKA